LDYKADSSTTESPPRWNPTKNQTPPAYIPADAGEDKRLHKGCTLNDEAGTLNAERGSKDTGFLIHLLLPDISFSLPTSSVS
jgi:hypothetical protein